MTRERAAAAEERTILATAPAFSPGGKAWRPFRFTRLEKLSRSHALLTDKLEWLVPSSSATGQANAKVLGRLRELFEVPAELMVDCVHVVSPKELRRYVAEPTFLATLAPLPHKTRGLVEVELGLAHTAIDILLGGAGENVALRPLTDIEEGVMSYVVLELLRALSPHLDPGLPRLRLESTVRGMDAAMALVADERQVVVVQYKCVLGTHSGFVRLLIPATVLGLASPGAQTADARDRRARLLTRHAGRLRGVKTWLRAEIGRAEIVSSDLAGLQTGDVVLADELSTRCDQGQPGTAQLRVGLGRAGYMEAEVFLEEGRYQARIAAFQFGDAAREQPEEPGAAPPPQREEDDERTSPTGVHTFSGSRRMDESTTSEAGELLNDIPLQIAVELARVPITADQVVALRVGQVVDLNRVPGEPVELSVNGKIVARGELVEVEGHLGVRILSMAG
jgi:type III secretion system YscQ/HrcQ family protein